MLLFPLAAMTLRRQTQLKSAPAAKAESVKPETFNNEGIILNHNMKPLIMQGIFPNSGVLGSLGTLTH